MWDPSEKAAAQAGLVDSALWQAAEIPLVFVGSQALGTTIQICLYFLFSAGSPRGCSFDDRITCPRSRACALMPREPHATQRKPNPVRQAPFLTCGRGQKRRAAALCSAQLRSAEPQITHGLQPRVLRRRERRREGTVGRCGTPRAPPPTQTVSSLSPLLQNLNVTWRSLFPFPLSMCPIIV